MSTLILILNRLDEFFEPTSELDEIPAVWRTKVDVPKAGRQLVPVYAAGWTMTYGEMCRKYNLHGSIYNASECLRQRWIEGGYDKTYENHPYIGLENDYHRHLTKSLYLRIIEVPKGRPYSENEFLFIFATNDSEEQMMAFQARREEMFQLMCKALGIDDPEDVIKIRKRYKWYKRMAPLRKLPEEAYYDASARNVFMRTPGSFMILEA
ncbi:hypothetical protein BDQ17DRAFT_1429682 [Cyathus striatus]|nr:hypothetical protein BDQ17DRAFT_1429682 [Cyathus striatus]